MWPLCMKKINRILIVYDLEIDYVTNLSILMIEMICVFDTRALHE